MNTINNTIKFESPNFNYFLIKYKLTDPNPPDKPPDITEPEPEPEPKPESIQNPGDNIESEPETES